MSPPNLLTMVKRIASQVVKEHTFNADASIMYQFAHALANRMGLPSSAVKQAKPHGYIINDASKGLSVLMDRKSAIVNVFAEYKRGSAQWTIQLPQVKRDEADASTSGEAKSTSSKKN